MAKPPACAAVVALALLGAARPASAVTDQDVWDALSKCRDYLLAQQNSDGSFGKPSPESEQSCLVFMTLARLGVHPNRKAMSKAMEYVAGLDTGKDMDADPRSGKCRARALAFRMLGLCDMHDMLLGEERRAAVALMKKDFGLTIAGQATDGGWGYGLDGKDSDRAVTCRLVSALADARRYLREEPHEPLKKALAFFSAGQNADGGWPCGKTGSSDLAATAEAAASLGAIDSALFRGAGCPCADGRSAAADDEISGRIEAGLRWLDGHFDGTATLDVLYGVGRAGLSYGRKYFGGHDWFRGGAERLVAGQKGNGSWGSLEDTCQSLLFLSLGREPFVISKLRFDGLWNMHRRDAANLTYYLQAVTCLPAFWRTSCLDEPVEALHDAPILFITAESVPRWSGEEGRKLRAFTDTGGTILLEASCGNADVRRWFPGFAKEVWPEWPLKKLAADDPLWGGTPGPPPMHRIKPQPDLFGIHDGLRTFLFYSPDDISCAWNMRDYASKGYLFDLGANLLRYATEGRWRRPRLGAPAPEPQDRFKGPIKAGPRQRIRIARVRHGGNWEVGANYSGFKRLAEALRAKAGVALETAEPAGLPYTQGGVNPKDLGGYDAAFITGSVPLKFTPEETGALKAYVAGGGLLWLEAARGSAKFDKSVRDWCEAAGWRLEILPPTDGLMTGRLGAAAGYCLTAGVQFRRAMRIGRLGHNHADLFGVFDGEKMIGVYSPLDVMFAVTPHEAYQCKGYLPPDAEAVATNIVFWLTGR